MKDAATCYAWGNADGWEAICVDFDLAAQGDSFEEVRSELSDAIDTFLAYAAELPELGTGPAFEPQGARWIAVEAGDSPSVFPLGDRPDAPLHRPP